MFRLQIGSQPLYNSEPPKKYDHNKTYYNLGTLGGARVWLVQSEQGTGTSGGAFATVSIARDRLKPAIVIGVGIAFGVNPSRQQIGEVLVAQQLLLYELRRISTGPHGEALEITRGDRVTISPLALDRYRGAAQSWNEPLHFGLVLSADKMVDHAPTVAALLGREPEMIGGEMEGAGLYLVATQHDFHWLLIKGISDWGDGNKAQDKEARQILAARNAARFTMHLIAQGGFARLNQEIPLPPQDIWPSQTTTVIVKQISPWYKRTMDILVLLLAFIASIVCLLNWSYNKEELVYANMGWNKTDIHIKKGWKVKLESEGSVKLSSKHGAPRYSPDGFNDIPCAEACFLNSAFSGELIARIGGNTQAIRVGSNLEWTAENDGRLELAINDKYHPLSMDDNSGYYRIYISSNWSFSAWPFFW